jgi:DNA-binding transcriptional ArsR family regulator
LAGSEGERKKKRKRDKGSKGKLRPDQIHALNHRTRRCILRALHASRGPSSPTRIAKALQMGLSNSSYHMNVLARFRTVKRVDEKQVRGAMEHFYVSTVADNPNVLAILEATRAEDEAE